MPEFSHFLLSGVFPVDEKLKKRDPKTEKGSLQCLFEFLFMGKTNKFIKLHKPLSIGTFLNTESIRERLLLCKFMQFVYSFTQDIRFTIYSFIYPRRSEVKPSINHYKENQKEQSFGFQTVVFLQSLYLSNSALFVHFHLFKPGRELLSIMST